MAMVYSETEHLDGSAMAIIQRGLHLGIAYGHMRQVRMAMSYGSGERF